MRMKSLYYLILMCILAGMPYASSNLITANVNVNCPYGIHLSVLPVYPRVGTIHANYTANTLSTCSVSGVSGYFSLINNGITVLNYSQSINQITQNVLTNQLIVNSLAIPSGNYTAEIYLQKGSYENSSTVNFELLPPANLSITSFTAGPANLSAPISLYSTIINNGYYAANSINLNLHLTGPVSFNLTRTINPLSPGQDENALITLYNATSIPGTYTVTENLTYSSDNANILSPSKTLTYTVLPIPKHSAGNPFPVTSGGSVSNVVTHPSISSTSNIYVVAAPLYVSTNYGSSIISLLGLKGILGNYTVSLSVPDNFSKMLLLSTNRLTLQNESTQYVQLVFNSTSAKPGTYIIPLNITYLSSTGQVRNAVDYLDFVSSTMNTNSPPVSISQQVMIINSSSSAQATIDIVSASNSIIRNATLYTYIPLSVGNISQISAYGLPNNITATKTSYLIKWYAPIIYPNQPVYAYYNIKKPVSQLPLSNIQNIFSSPSQTNQSSIMKIVAVSLSNIYQNSNGTLTLSVLYTGTAEQQIKFSLSGTQNISISDPIAYINATPNELITHTFRISDDNYTGTAVSTLSVSTLGASYSQPVEINLLQTPAAITSKQLSGYPIITFMLIYRQWIIAAVIAIVLITMAIFAIKSVRSARFRPKDSRTRIIRLREHIKRTESDGNGR